MGQRVGVLMGGWGEEREISVKTGEGIVAALTALGHTVTRLFAGPGLDRLLRASEVDVAFLALHGRMGEDGKVQGLLEVLEVPYTGSGVMASALAMNKPFAKELFAHHNLPVAAGYRVRRGELHRAAERHADLGFPCVVKPSFGGSTVGVALVREPSALLPAIAEACRYGGEALIERHFAGRELTVGILDGEVLGSCEVAFDAEMFDFESKYRGGSQYFLPPRLPPTRVANLEALALRAYRALDCRGYGRVDLLASDDGNEVVLEVNTLPGMTQTSLLPKIAAKAGLPYEALVARILSLATRDDVCVATTPELQRPGPGLMAG